MISLEEPIKILQKETIILNKFLPVLKQKRLDGNEDPDLIDQIKFMEEKLENFNYSIKKLNDLFGNHNKFCDFCGVELKCPNHCHFNKPLI